jgi:hypothetical protein
LCVYKLKKPLSLAQVSKKAQWLGNGFFLLFALIFFQFAFANPLTSVKVPASNEKIDATKSAPATTAPNNITVATSSVAALPKLKLSTRISNHTAQLSNNTHPTPSVKFSEIATEADAPTNIALNAASTDQNDVGKLYYTLAKKEAESRWQQENKWLIAITLIFATAIIIAFVLTKIK